MSSSLGTSLYSRKLKEKPTRLFMSEHSYLTNGLPACHKYLKPKSTTVL